MKGHIQEIDTLRAIAIIFIILSHVDSYTSFVFFDRYDDLFAFFGLSLFFFISGYLLSYKNNFGDKNNILKTLKKRAFRIYPLYWLSIIISYFMIEILAFDLLYLENYETTNKLALFVHIIGLNGFIAERYSLSIWWFVGVILLYYLLYNINLHYSKNIRDVFIYSVILILPLLFLRNEFGIINTKTFIYYFTFLAGVVIGLAKNFESLKKIIVYYFITILFFLALSYWGIDIYNILNTSKRNLIFSFIVIFFAAYKIKIYDPDRYKQPIFLSKIAYSSYAIYLFHIPILTMLKYIFALLIVEEKLGEFVNNWSILFIGIPATLFLGYYIQRLFDKMSPK